MSILQETRRNFSTPDAPLDDHTVYRNPRICPWLSRFYRQLSQYERGRLKVSHRLKECHKTRLEHSIKETKKKINTIFLKRYPLLGLKSQNLTIWNYFWEFREHLTWASILKNFDYRRESIIVRKLTDDKFKTRGWNLNWRLLAFDVGTFFWL